jgi:hypothetical protein
MIELLLDAYPEAISKKRMAMHFFHFTWLLRRVDGVLANMRAVAIAISR